MDRLVLQQLLEPLESGRVYSLSHHLRQRYLEALARERPESGLESRPESRLESGLESEVNYRILSVLKTAALFRSEIARELGYKTVSGALNRAIARLLEHGFIGYTIPEKPQSRLQKYRLTEKGRRYLTERKEGSK